MKNLIFSIFLFCMGLVVGLFVMSEIKKADLENCGYCKEALMSCKESLMSCLKIVNEK